jgi:hypothetical protein
VISHLFRWSLTPLVLLVFASAAFGQSEINGRVVDPDDKPVAGLDVILHAVTETAGTDVDKATTAADGTFTLSAKSSDPNAIYFVAVTWKGELYIGELMRQPFPANQEYLVRVGVNPVDIPQPEVAPELSAEEKKQNRSRGAVVIVAAGLIIAGLLGFGLKRRPAAQRRWLVELARIEDDIATDPDSTTLQKRRTELRERLKAPKRG